MSKARACVRARRRARRRELRGGFSLFILTTASFAVRAAYHSDLPQTLNTQAPQLTLRRRGVCPPPLASASHAFIRIIRNMCGKLPDPVPNHDGAAGRAVVVERSINLEN